QPKLATMLASVTTMQLLCLRLAQLQEEGKMTDAMASLAKMNNARLAREVVADAREMLGGNGILLDYHIARHHADIEAVFTYEGTDTIQSLIGGREMTGKQAFSSQQTSAERITGASRHRRDSLSLQRIGGSGQSAATGAPSMLT